MKKHLFLLTIACIASFNVFAQPCPLTPTTCQVCSGATGTLTSGNSSSHNYTWEKWNPATMSWSTQCTPCIWQISVTCSTSYGLWRVKQSTCLTWATFDVVSSGAACRLASGGADPGFITSIYPNPSAGTFTLNIESANMDGLQIVVLDMAGKQVQSYKGSDVQLSTNIFSFGSDLAVGMYFVSIRQGEHESLNRVIKTE